MGHRFKHTGECGAGLDHPEHDTTPGEEAAEDAVEKAKSMREVLQAERDVAISRVRELYRALGSGGGDILSDAELAMALEKIASLRNHARVADETIANVRREHDLAKTRVTMLRDEVDSQRRKNDEAYIEIETLRRANPPRGDERAKSATPTAFSLSTERLLERAALSPSGKKIVDECFRLAEMLIEKNIAYGDSALNPLRVFAKDIDARAQILVRLDDKLSRLARGSAAGEDVILDLLGYLILYRIAPAPATAEKPAVDPVKAALKGISVREPTPEEVAMLRRVATESEENSPYQERRFVECPMCRAKPGSPLLCDDCLKRRSAAWIP